MKNPPNPCNKNNDSGTNHCPTSPLAADTIKKLAESIDDLTSAAAKMSVTEGCPEFVAARTWLRAERVGQTLDRLIDHWEQQDCPALCLDCQWHNIERGLAIINTLTPCNQWFAPEIWDYINKKTGEE